MASSTDTKKKEAIIRDIPARMRPRGKIPMLDSLRHNKRRLPLCWYSVFKTPGWMSRSEFVWLFGFRYTFPCLGWMRVLPLPYGQIRIINWSNSRAHFDIRERDCKLEDSWKYTSVLSLLCTFSSNMERDQKTICLRSKSGGKMKETLTFLLLHPSGTIRNIQWAPK